MAKAPGGWDFTGVPRIEDVGIVPNPNPKMNPVACEKFDPVCPDEFPVRRQTPNPVVAEFNQKVCQQGQTFVRMRIAAFVQQSIHKRGTATP